MIYFILTSGEKKNLKNHFYALNEDLKEIERFEKLWKAFSFQILMSFKKTMEK